MPLFRKYKSTQANRRTSRRQSIKRIQLAAFRSLDDWRDVFCTSIVKDDPWDDVRMITLPGRTLRWNRQAAMEINADAYRANHRADCRVDYESVHRQPEFELRVPKELSWPRNEVDLSEAPPDSAQLASRQWVSIESIERLSIDANDRWMYLVHAKQRLKYAPGEWLYLYRSELTRVFPSLGSKQSLIADRNAFLMNTIRGEDEKPTELRVYSSTYLPLFRVVLDFVDPNHPVQPYGDGVWWHHTKYPWAYYARDLKNNEEVEITTTTTTRTRTEGNDIQGSPEGTEGVIPVST